MSRSSSLDAAVKGVMLIPLAVLAYFHDVPVWISTIYSTHMLGFLVAAVTLCGLGLWLKRGIVGTYLEMSEGSSVLGVILLFAAIGVYIYGSWYGFTSFLHFESLLVLSASYGFFRLDARFMRLAAPLLALFAFILPLPFLGTIARHDIPLYVPVAFVVLFALYLRKSPKSLALPALVATTGALYWLVPAYLPLPEYWPFSAYGPLPAFWPLACAPLLCLALLVPRQLRVREQLQVGDSRQCTLHGDQGTVVRGFCSMCGRKRYISYTGHLGLVGLGVVLVGLYALSVTQVPVLSFQNGVPSYTIYTPQAIVGSQIPQTPQGWLVNSTTTLNPTRPLNLSTPSPIGDLYAVKQVYVPSYRPETENYTLYYEVSSGAPIVGGSWKPMVGWNYSSSLSQALSLQGRLFVYTSPRATLLVYTGNEQLYFITGTSIELLNVGISVTRQFEGTTVPNATSVFTNDLQGLFQPGITAETYYSAWTGYFARVYQTAEAVYGLLALISSAGFILWSAYRVELSDTKVDSFVTGASELDDEAYSLLATQLEAGRANRTGNDVAALAGVGQEDARGLARIFGLLKELERNGLVKAALVESGSDLLLKWKATA